MLFSIIIPVYNVEKYLNFCVDSILCQDFKDYEIILVDDGSKDSSGKICDEYSTKHKNILAYHKQNGGLSDARNFGLHSANGDYILFVDSDDYIAEGCLKQIACTISKYSSDVVFLNANKFFPNGTIIPLGDNYNAESINGKSKDDVMKHIATLPKYPGSACTKAIKRKLIFDNSLFFEKDLLSEDIDWTIRLFTLAHSFSYCDHDYYFYRQQRIGSITNTVNIRNIECLIYIIKKWAYKESDVPYQNEINSFLAYEYMIALFGYSKLSKQEQKLLEHDFKEYRWILKYGKNKKTKLINATSKLVGINLTASLLKFIKK